jgi:hypothetical protein
MIGNRSGLNLLKPLNLKTQGNLMAKHDVIVKAGLTADQYLAFHKDAEMLGLSDSGCLRVLVTKFIRDNAMRKLSISTEDDESTKTVLFQGLVDEEIAKADL